MKKSILELISELRKEIDESQKLPFPDQTLADAAQKDLDLILFIINQK